MADQRVFCKRNDQCCDECKAECHNVFKKVLELKNSGLIVYVHQNHDKKTASTRDKYDTVILFNTTDKYFKRPTFMSEFGQQKVKCFHCRTLIQRVRNLLTEIKFIKGNETIGVCDYCKRSNVSNCKRCEYIVSKFMSQKDKSEEMLRQYYKAWVSKVMAFLQSLYEGSLCEHNFCQRDVEELRRLLNELKSPLSIRQPDIEMFPFLEQLETFDNLTESKELLDKLLLKFKAIDEMYPNITTPIHCTPMLCIGKNSKEENIQYLQMKDKVEVKNKKNKNKEKIILEKERTNKKIKNEIHSDEDKKSKKQKRKDKKEDALDKNEKMMLKLMAENLLGRNKSPKELKGVKSLPITKVQPLPDLPALHTRELVETSSASIIECADTRVISKVMIKGQNIVPLLSHDENQNNDRVPLLYHIEKDISTHSYQSPSIAKTISMSSSLPAITSVKNKSKSEVTRDKGVIRYQLSDPECIYKGWTSLPSLKIKRRMNVYKMNPVNPGNNWFKRNKNRTITYEGCDETFADIDDEGFGKLYYKNGRIALEYYKAKEPYAGHRYIIYSNGEPENGISKPVTVLGVFDGIGSGVIYDNYGCERLKYNQSEGMLIDKRVDSPCKWKWHTLNDPPVLQPVFVDTYCKKSETLIGNKDEETESSTVKNADMLTIELENFLKEKADKMLQKLKPIEIKPKVLKINHQFSLRIFQQADIYLMFREGRTCAKINIGLMLLSNEIVYTETIDVPQVCTSYDRFPPRSESIENIQRITASARNLKRKSLSV